MRRRRSYRPPSSSGFGAAFALGFAIAAIILVAFLLSRAGAPAPEYRSSAPMNASTQSTPKGTIVYVNEGGSVYHRSECSQGHGMAKAMALELARREYAPCPACWCERTAVVTHTVDVPVPEISYRSSAPDTATMVARSQYLGPTVGYTATGKTIYEGPRGGHYHYSASGKKVYEKKRR